MGTYSKRFVGMFCLFFAGLPVFSQPGHLNQELTTATHEYHVYWTDDNTSEDFVSDAMVQDVFDALDPTHQIFLDLGFAEPYWSSDPKKVWFEEDVNDTAVANLSYIIYRPSRTNSLGEMTLREIAMHEMFHHEQYAYVDNSEKDDWGDWLIEATARMMQDKTYADMDQNTSASPSYTFYGEIKSYLDNPNQTLMDISYTACLYWHYLTEQFGEESMTALQAGDPELYNGVDFMRRMFERTVDVDPDTVGVVDELISDIDSRHDFESAWQNFTIANYLKDFSVVIPGVPVFPPIYGYKDDDDAGQSYPKVAKTSVGTLTTSVITENFDVARWGADYYEGTVSANTQIYGVQVDADEEASLAVTLVNDANQAVSLYKTFGKEVKQAYYYDRENPISKIALVIGGMDERVTGDALFVGGKATLEIQRPTFNSPEYVGSATEPEKFIVRLRVTGPPELGSPSVQGLNYSDFTVQVGTEEANVLYGLDVQGEFWLTVQAPKQAAAGKYNLTVTLGENPGVSDSETLAVDYTIVNRSQMFVVDNSGSMSSDGKMDAAINAGLLLVSVIPDDDQLGVVNFSTNASTPLPLSTSNILTRIAGGLAINNLTPDGLTSIGDGLDAASTQLGSKGNPSNLHYITLMSDGHENESLFWSDMQAEIVNSATTVNTIGFGPEADSDTLAEIAFMTDGDFYYVDTGTPTATAKRAERGPASSTPQSVSNPAALELPNRLANVYAAIEEGTQGKARLWSSYGTVDESGLKLDIPVTEPNARNGLLVINWSSSASRVSATLTRPDDTTVVSGVSGASIEQSTTVIVIRLEDVLKGDWHLELDSSSGSVQYLAALSAENLSGVEAQLILQGERSGRNKDIGAFRYLRGLPMPIHLLLTDISGPVSTANATAYVSLPDGSVDELVLFDDGAHGDNQSGDGLYSIVFRRTIFASNDEDTPTAETGVKATANGNYNVTVLVDGRSNSGAVFHRELMAGFHVYEYPLQYFTAFHVDDDSDGLPDRWENLWGLNPALDDTALDPDRDGLVNRDEYMNGTIPVDPDTDNGGEGDGSELNRKANPSMPLDDLLPRPRDVRILINVHDDYNLPEPEPNVISLHYPFSKFYKSVRVYRALAPGGPYAPIAEIVQADANGTYRDAAVALGTTYYYYVVGVGDGGAESAPSPVVFGEAKADPIAPFGWVGINHGAHIVDTLTASVQLSESTDAVEMRISDNAGFGGMAWVPFKTFIPSVGISPDPITRLAVVFVQLRDAAGNVSPTEHVLVKYEPGGDFDGDGIINSLDTDDDDDGLSDLNEIYSTHTNPVNEDSDRDGVMDGNEDADSDGLSNSEEIGFGTNPLKADTDGDGFEDKVELSEGTSPTNASSYPGAPTPTPTVTPSPTMGTVEPTPTRRFTLNLDFIIRFILPNHDDVLGGLRGPRQILIHPSGRFLFVNSEEGGALFHRNPETGKIEYAGRLFGTELRGLQGNLALSPDGSHFYLARVDGKLYSFAVNPDTGKLQLLQDVVLETVGKLTQAPRMILSGDGFFLYIVIPGQERILAYQRDIKGGRVTFSKLTRIEGGTTTQPIGILDLAISMDGRVLLVLTNGSRPLTIFTRNLDSGNLVLQQQVELPIRTPSGGEMHWDRLQLSGNGQRIVVLDSKSGRLAHLRRGSEGNLILLDVVESDFAFNGLDIAWLPEGQQFLTLAPFGIGAFSLDEADKVKLLNKLNQEGLGKDLLDPAAMALSMDGRFLYVVTRGRENIPGAIAVIEIVRGGDEPKPTPTKRDEFEPTPTKRDEQDPTPTKRIEDGPTPTKRIEQDPTPTKREELDPTWTPTKHAEPEPTKPPIVEHPNPRPEHVFRFDKNLLEEGFSEVPGGFTPGTKPGRSFVSEIPRDPKNKATDGKGVILHCQPGEVQLLLAKAIKVGQRPVIIKMAAKADSEEGNLALAALDGGLDGSIATLIPNNTRHLMDNYKRLAILYEPLNTDTLSVVIQLAVPENARGPVTVFIDNVQIIPLDENSRVGLGFLKFGELDENDE